MAMSFVTLQGALGVRAHHVIFAYKASRRSTFMASPAHTNLRATEPASWVVSMGAGVKPEHWDWESRMASPVP